MWNIILHSNDNNEASLKGPNSVVIHHNGGDRATFNVMSQKWSYDQIGKTLNGKPQLYDILKPIARTTPYSIGVYFAHPEKGHNKFATKVLSHNVKGDVLLVKTYDDGENPTVVKTLSPDEFSMSVFLPTDVWVDNVCQETCAMSLANCPTCRGCGKPYVTASTGQPICQC
eukprot:jgi/Mesvir1/18586/Mv17095-RA.1